MGLLEQQNFLARIFTDEDLRSSFGEDPEETGTEYGLNSADVTALKGIIFADLDFFCDSLIGKRLREVRKMLPLTAQLMQNQFEHVFRIFADQFHSGSTNKHFADAVQFCRFLQSQSFENALFKDTAKFEKTKLEFFGSGKSAAFCLLQHNIFTAKKRPCLVIWYRWGSRSRHVVW